MYASAVQYNISTLWALARCSILQFGVNTGSYVCFSTNSMQHMHCLLLIQPVGLCYTSTNRLPKQSQPTCWPTKITRPPKSFESASQLCTNIASILLVPPNFTGSLFLQVSGAPSAVSHTSKRQRLSLLGSGSLFTVPRTSLLFPALNPVIGPEGIVVSQQSLVAAYIESLKVCWLQKVNPRLLPCKTCCVLSHILCW